MGLFEKEKKFREMIRKGEITIRQKLLKGYPRLMERLKKEKPEFLGKK
mgnify:CR=1 FL=1